jgi:glucose/arabinose dehydrogenase
VAAAVVLALAALLLLGCMERAKLPVEAGYGRAPSLPAPDPSLIPTMEIAPATGWPADRKPVPAPGLQVNAFATGLDHPRWLFVLPNGDLLVAETNAPASGGGGGIRGWIMRKMKQRAGGGAPSADRITLLRDTDGDGATEVREVFLAELHSPFGMELVGRDFYVANTDALVRFPYRNGETRITAPAVVVADLPAGSRNRHWTRNLIASPDGSKLYVAIGSDSNAAETGMDVEYRRAAILEVDAKSGRSRVFASGLRNPVGMDWEPRTGALWTVVNERDEIGSDLVPDYLTSVHQGGFYGWPYSYFGAHVDERVQPQRPELVARALVPEYALGPHTGSLGLVFYEGSLLPARYHGGAFIGQHGSWNREPKSGYRVAFVRFADGQPTGPLEDVLTGFLDEQGNAQGRPVGVAIDREGALLVADDVGNVVWRVTPN